MVIAVLPVRVMQMALHEKIHVISVRHALMAAGGTVNVVGLMPIAVMVERTLARVCGSI
jgi:hypothetical protein